MRCDVELCLCLRYLDLIRDGLVDDICSVGMIGCSCLSIAFLSLHLPSNGLSDVTGIVADTMLRNTVKERSMVTPESVLLVGESL